MAHHDEERSVMDNNEGRSEMDDSEARAGLDLNEGRSDADIAEQVEREFREVTGKYKPPMRVFDYVGEVAGLILFLAAWWRPRWSEQACFTVPGFGGLGLEPGVLGEMSYLVEEIRDELEPDSSIKAEENEALRAEGEALIRRLRQMCRWRGRFDADVRVSAKRLDERARGQGRRQVAETLLRWGRLARSVKADLVGLPGFEDGLLDHVEAVAAALQEIPRRRSGRLRVQRLLFMLHARVGLLREGGRMVFAGEPTLLPQLYSETRRQRRMARVPEPEPQGAAAETANQ